MSFLAGRLAGKEGAYFLKESKLAVGRLVEKNKGKVPSASCNAENESPIRGPDVLPEILRHSLPSKIFQPLEESSLSTASKWVLHSDPNKLYSVSQDAINPLRAYVSLPQVTFGPRRWQLPNADNSFLASTANDSRRDKHTPVNPEKLKATAVGFSQIAKAFAIATTIVFGGAAAMFVMATSKLELQNGDDIRTQGKVLFQPRLEMIKEQVMPLRTWAEGMSEKWHICKEEDIKEKPLIKELSKILGAKTSN